MNEVHIDTTGMTDSEKVVALITEIFNHVSIEKKKKKAKEIRAESRRIEKNRKKSRNGKNKI